ncbi:MAG: recombination-associated protein RdgC [Desulfobacterales bacterium]|nr:recombination-associated protein RdgC [Desulfobacterales bacterium]
MGILSASTSVTRYRVSGALEKPVLEAVFQGLGRYVIREMDEDQWEVSEGWTSFENPYLPDFEGSSFVIGPFLVFSLRVDKKSIPAKIVRKDCAVEMAGRLKKNGRQYLSRSEKNAIKEQVTDLLVRRIPATPNSYDVIWHPEQSRLWFFSNLKRANEALENLFFKSFNLRLIRLFPFTLADLAADLSDPDRDRLITLSPTNFSE